MLRPFSGLTLSSQVPSKGPRQRGRLPRGPATAISCERTHIPRPVRRAITPARTQGERLSQTEDCCDRRPPGERHGSTSGQRASLAQPGKALVSLGRLGVSRQAFRLTLAPQLRGRRRTPCVIMYFVLLTYMLLRHMVEKDACI